MLVVQVTGLIRGRHHLSADGPGSVERGRACGDDCGAVFQPGLTPALRFLTSAGIVAEGLP
jgi:hypothetical protein